METNHDLVGLVWALSEASEVMMRTEDDMWWTGGLGRHYPWLTEPQYSL